MKDAVTHFDLEAAFKALDEIDTPTVCKGIKANKPALTEIFSRKSKFDALFEDYYNVNDSNDLTAAKEEREAEIAQAKLARIEKIVDLDAESPEDLLTSYVGKFIMQCPQCMTLFYKAPEDIEESEDDPLTVNVNEVCQHCGNETGYALVGKVGEVTPDELEPEVEAEPDEENTEETENLDLEVDGNLEDEESLEVEDSELSDEDLEELDFDLEDDEEEEKKEESFYNNHHDNYLFEGKTKETDTESGEISEAEFKELLNSDEFKRPISDRAARMMMQKMDDKEEMTESFDKSNDLIELFNECAYDVIEAGYTDAEEIIVTLNHSAGDVAEAAEELIAILEVNGHDILNWNTNGNNVFIFKLARQLTEGIFDKAKDFIKKFTRQTEEATDKLDTREEKADWVLEHALIPKATVQLDSNNEVIVDKSNRRYEIFAVIGFDKNYSNGKEITMAPTPGNKDLVRSVYKEVDKYKNADEIAKNWSLKAENGPAAIYMAKNGDDTKAEFLCEYFDGKLFHDKLESIVERTEKDLVASVGLAKNGMDTSDYKKVTAKELKKGNRVQFKNEVAEVVNVTKDINSMDEDGLVISFERADKTIKKLSVDADKIYTIFKEANSHKTDGEALIEKLNNLNKSELKKVISEL